MRRKRGERKQVKWFMKWSRDVSLSPLCFLSPSKGPDITSSQNPPTTSATQPTHSSPSSCFLFQTQHKTSSPKEPWTNPCTIKRLPLPQGSICHRKPGGYHLPSDGSLKSIIVLSHLRQSLQVKILSRDCIVLVYGLLWSEKLNVIKRITESLTSNWTPRVVRQASMPRHSLFQLLDTLLTLGPNQRLSHSIQPFKRQTLRRPVITIQRSP